MLTQDFDFYLPKDKIASHPVSPRDHSRLMVLDKKKKKISDHFFYELKDILKEGDLLIANDSKVLPARLYGTCERGKKIEVLLLRAISDNKWEALVRGGKEEVLDFSGVRGKVEKVGEAFELIFEIGGPNLIKHIYKIGEMPLPPYIKRESPNEKDKQDYQTIFASKEGSVAAPTAGLHFTQRLLRELEEKGIDLEFVTLHIGLGTFRPVKTDVVQDHKMHSESYWVSKNTAEAINKAKKEGRRVIAIGTTSLRTLEAASQSGGQVVEGFGSTDIFIYPGYKFKVTSGLITNFHLPKSTLMMLVSAFGGKELVKNAYQKAIEGPYRFYSYGDAMLLL
jgi:S-adenosylmethionine:tRNA ribosyltransferase-isomerase